MKQFCFMVAFVTSTFAWSLGASANPGAGELIQIQDLKLTIPDGWTLQQKARDEGTMILGFGDGASYLTMYVREGEGLNMRDVFVNGSQVVTPEHPFGRGGYEWTLLDTSKGNRDFASYYMTAFKMDLNGYCYYGYAKAGSTSQSNQIVIDFLSAIE